MSGFRPEVRATVILLTGSAMDDFVVAHRKILQPFSEGKIAVRHLVGGRLSRSGEEQLSNLSGIHDLQQVKGQIRHQATVHGAKLASGVRRAVVDLVEDLVVPNLVFNPQETSDAQGPSAPPGRQSSPGFRQGSGDRARRRRDHLEARAHSQVDGGQDRGRGRHAALDRRDRAVLRAASWAHCIGSPRGSSDGSPRILAIW